MFRGSRPRKRWRYVAFFCEQLSGCAALVQIGPARQSFWALQLAGEPALRERTRLLPRGEVVLAQGRPGDSQHPGLVRVRDDGVELELRVREGDAIEALCTHGRQQVWTRKQAGVPARGALALDGGAARPIEALAIVDDTCGYHARRTEWWWSAGVGEGSHGELLAWNLVSGVNDPPTGSERAVWVDRAAREVGPVSFASDLSLIRGEDGSELSFKAASERSRRENLLLVRSEYRAPFGTFSGTLPGAVPLARGRGVMEHHRAWW